MQRLQLTCLFNFLFKLSLRSNSGAIPSQNNIRTILFLSRYLAKFACDSYMICSDYDFIKLICLTNEQSGKNDPEYSISNLIPSGQE